MDEQRRLEAQKRHQKKPTEAEKEATEADKYVFFLYTSR